MQVTQIIYRIETLGGPHEVQIDALVQDQFPEYQQIVAYQSSPDGVGHGSVPLFIMELLLTNLDRPKVQRLCHEIKDIVGDRVVRLIELPVLQFRVF
jgi:hypothetical protein